MGMAFKLISIIHPERTCEIPPSFARLSHTKRLAQRPSCSGNTPLPPLPTSLPRCMVDFPRKYESRDCIPLCLIINLRKAMSNAKVAHFIIAYHQMTLYHLQTLLQTCPRPTTLFARPQGSASSYLRLCFIWTRCRWWHTLLVWIFVLEHRRSLSSPSSGFLSICTLSHLLENIHEAFFIISLEAHTICRAAHCTRSYGFYGRVLRLNTRTVRDSSRMLNGPEFDGMYPSWPIEWRPLWVSYGYGYLQWILSLKLYSRLQI